MAITVTYTEQDGSPKEIMSRDGISVTRLLKCAWSDRVRLAKELLGFQVDGILHAPDRYDAGDEPIYNIYCKDVKIESIGVYEYAILTCTYVSLDQLGFDPEDAPRSGSTVYITENIEGNAEYVTIHNEKLYWDAAKTEPVNEMETPGYLIIGWDWVVTQHNTTASPTNLLIKPGTVNSDTVYSQSLDLTFPPETLLCHVPSLSRTVTSDGVSSWEITWRFSVRPETWNKFPHVGDTGPISFDYMYDNNGSVKLFYPTSNFTSFIYI